jgi:hypothetical protein
VDVDLVGPGTQLRRKRLVELGRGTGAADDYHRIGLGAAEPGGAHRGDGHQKSSALYTTAPP